MGLSLYQKKRNFGTTPEPRGRVGRVKSRGLAFVIQKHAASHLHYDFRLELDGVLLSWAVPKGPSLNPDEKRLAMHVEDHPIEYGKFEGVIPPGQYGSGTVMLWDRGTWTPEGDAHEGLKKGNLKFSLDGEKLQGRWVLVKSHGGKYGGEKAWLLIKKDDEFARPAHQPIAEDAPDSVVSGRSLEAIAADGDRTWEGGKSVAQNVAAGATKARRATNKSKAVPKTAPPTPESKPGRRMTRSTPIDDGAEVAGVQISNPAKQLYPDAGVTKLQLARYYEAVGDWIVPHIRNRPLTLVRCPDGWNKQCFYQKNAPDRLHKAIKPVVIETSDGPAVYMMANSTEAVVAMLQSGALELHPWGSSAKKLGHPDRIVLDFDPGEGLDWKPLVEAVTMVRTLLEELGLRCFLKTTGGKGLHIVVPIQPVLDWDTVKAFTKAIADNLAHSFPDRFTAKLAKSGRQGKIFIDYLRNAEGATAVSAFSLRARANAPVATPIAWEELSRDVRNDYFNVGNVPERLRKLKKDPWADFFLVKQRVTVAMLKQMGVR